MPIHFSKNPTNMPLLGTKSFDSHIEHKICLSNCNSYKKCKISIPHAYLAHLFTYSLVSVKLTVCQLFKATLSYIRFNLLLKRLYFLILVLFKTLKRDPIKGTFLRTFFVMLLNYSMMPNSKSL